jgi:hypothetical protein
VIGPVVVLIAFAALFVAIYGLARLLDATITAIWRAVAMRR